MYVCIWLHVCAIQGVKYLFVCMYVYIYMRAIDVYVCMYVIYIYVCMYVCNVYICMYVCM